MNIKKITVIIAAALIALSSSACKKAAEVDNISSEPISSTAVSSEVSSAEEPVDNGIRLVVTSQSK